MPPPPALAPPRVPAPPSVGSSKPLDSSWADLLDAPGKPSDDDEK
jgi:hypothetical protein